MVQAVLLYGADSWVVKNSDLQKLNSFHKRAMRYMTGCHIRRYGEDWEYPDHKILLRRCRLFPIETYLERQRGTLREYFMENRRDLLDEAIQQNRHAKDVHKIFWWNQAWMAKEEMRDLNKLWYPL